MFDPTIAAAAPVYDPGVDVAAGSTAGWSAYAGQIGIIIGIVFALVLLRVLLKWATKSVKQPALPPGYSFKKTVNGKNYYSRYGNTWVSTTNTREFDARRS